MKPILSKKDIIQNLLHKELIDIPVTIIEHPDPAFLNLSGLIVKESKQMLHIKINGKIIQVPKANGKFGFTLDGQQIRVMGDLLLGLVKQRSKRKHKSW